MSHAIDVWLCLGCYGSDDLDLGPEFRRVGVGNLTEPIGEFVYVYSIIGQSDYESAKRLIPRPSGRLSSMGTVLADPYLYPDRPGQFGSGNPNDMDWNALKEAIRAVRRKLDV